LNPKRQTYTYNLPGENMKLKQLHLAILATLATAAISAVSAQERVIKMGTGLTGDHPQNQASEFFGKRVSEMSGGKMVVRLFPNGALGNDVTMISALQGGTQEMAVPDTGTLGAHVKEFGLINLPFTFNNSAEADKVMDGPFGQKLLAKLPEKGLIGLGYWENGFRHVSNSRRDIKTAADFEGLKLRVIQNPLYIDTFKALGVNATPMPFPEVFGALETKTVDGQENPAATILASKFYEVQKNVVLSGHIYSVWVPLFSKKIWDTYTAAEQAILRKAAVEAQAFERVIIRAFDSKALDDLKARGMTITTLSPAEKAKVAEKLKPVVAALSKNLGEAAAAEMMEELAKARK
jgi:TRAP-type transport system periplasmic protein